MDAEYGVGGQVTTKGHVYSYGVTTKGHVYSYGIVLLEMFTRKQPTHDMFVEGMTLHKWVGKVFQTKYKKPGTWVY